MEAQAKTTAAQSYLLAAGRGRRAGGPKAWLLHEGKTLLERQAGFLLKRFAPGSIAVSVQADWLPRCAGLHAGIRWVPVDPDASPLAALQALLKAAPLERWAFLHHVDMPVWEEGLFAELGRAAVRAEEAGADAVIPVYKGRGGHPIVLSPKLAAGIEALEPSGQRLDMWLQSRRAFRIEVPFACVLENWNAGARQL